MILLTVSALGLTKASKFFDVELKTGLKNAGPSTDPWDSSKFSFLANKEPDKNLTNSKNVYYYTDVYLGSNSQKIRMIIDTTTNKIMVPSQDCEECVKDKKIQVYNFSSSTTSNKSIPLN